MTKTFELKFLIIAASLMWTGACKQGQENQSTNNTSDSVVQSQTMESVKYKSKGSIERLDPLIDQVIKPDAQLEIIAEGFDWTEGPLWLPGEKKLIFSDIPPNKIHSWNEEEGLKLYLTPSGFTSKTQRGGEVGSNGLILDNEGRLVLCQHGDRRMARMNASLTDPKADFITLADKFEGKRLNSPNDAVFKSNGDLYFTDPPYGLEKNEDDPSKEIPFQGVYRVDKEGKVKLLTKELSRPNGIAFSPDEKTLYVANSDPDKAIWMAYDVDDNGSISNGRVFYDATDKGKTDKGLPDGLKINRSGIIFATGPGGVWVFSKEGKPWGLIRTGEATSNCAFNEDESVLYITADNYVLRLGLK